MFAFSQSSGSILVSINLWKIDVRAGGIWHATFGNISFDFLIYIYV
jgi:hypothetical protein